MSQQINLYDSRLRPRRELATARNLGVAALALLLAVTAGAGYARLKAAGKQGELASVQAELRGEQAKLAALGKQVAEQRVSPALLGEIATARAVLGVREEVLAVLDAGQLGNTTGFSAVMTGFARQTVPDLWLTGFVIGRGGEDIEIRGRLLDPSRLPTYVQRLSDEAAFQGRRFATLDMKSVDPAAVRPDAAVAAPPAALPARPALPRHVEFVLRSEVVAPAAAASAKSASPAAGEVRP